VDFIPCQINAAIHTARKWSVATTGLAGGQAGLNLTPDQRRLLDALIDQGALAIERVILVEDIERTRLSVETEKLRSAILTSLSHDLKTPLASVLGAAGALRDLGGLTDLQRTDLLSTIIEEAERLNRFIANLLDMMKLESGAVRPNSGMHDVSEVVGSVLRRTEKILAEHKIEVALAADLPMIEVDPVLFEQVLFNVLDNASKYAPVGTTVRISAQQAHDKIRLQIEDEGAGIPSGEAEHIFDRFHRATKASPGRGSGSRPAKRPPGRASATCLPAATVACISENERTSSGWKCDVKVAGARLVTPLSSGRPSARHFGPPPSRMRMSGAPMVRNSHQTRGAENSPASS